MIPTMDNISGTNESEDFAWAIGVRGEISKVYGNLKSTNVSPADGVSSIFDEPVMLTIDSLDSLLMSMLDPSEVPAVQASIAAIAADKSSGISLKLLAKLWCIPDNLPKGAIDQSAQLCRHNAYKCMSRNLSANDRMLKYKQLQTGFFTDTTFALMHKSTCGNMCSATFLSVTKDSLLFIQWSHRRSSLLLYTGFVSKLESLVA